MPGKLFEGFLLPIYGENVDDVCCVHHTIGYYINVQKCFAMGYGCISFSISIMLLVAVEDDETTGLLNYSRYQFSRRCKIRET